MKRRPLAGTGFGESELPGIEIESGKRTPSIRNNAALFPMQPAGDHEMKNQPQIVIQSKRDPFPDAAHGGYSAAIYGFKPGSGGAPQPRPRDLGGLGEPPSNAMLARTDI